MRFEYDPDKSAANLAKHGISFDTAQTLWRDPNLLEVPAKTQDEPRYLVIAKIGAKHWAAIWTPRGALIRIISVRRARKQEIAYYEST